MLRRSIRIWKTSRLAFSKGNWRNWRRRKGIFRISPKINEKDTHASYLISLRIAQAKKSHTVGECLVLPEIIDVVGVMSGDKRSKRAEWLRFPITRFHVGSMKCLSGQTSWSKESMWVNEHNLPTCLIMRNRSGFVILHSKINWKQ
jgi:hypothetical protein